MVPSSKAAHLPPVLALALVIGCSGGNAASSLSKPPEFRPEGQTKCGVSKSQARPLIVEWPSADRAALELQAKRGLVAVKYVGCEMEVLRQCTGPGSYRYTGITRKDDRIVIRDEDELYANVPVYAARLEGKLQKSGELDVNMTIVGAYEAERGAVRAEELEGDCAAATHVITSLTTGAFEFFAGADAEVAGGATVAGMGGGARSGSLRELLNRDGDKSACAQASPGDKDPPAQCGALLRVEVVPIARSQPSLDPAAAPIDISGDWDTEYQDGPTHVKTVIRFVQTGDRVTGTYADGGRYQGTMKGRVLTAQWFNGGTGRVEMTFSEDGKSFTAAWGVDTGPLTAVQTGHRR